MPWRSCVLMSPPSPSSAWLTGAAGCWRSRCQRWVPGPWVGVGARGGAATVRAQLPTFEKRAVCFRGGTVQGSCWQQAAWWVLEGVKVLSSVGAD